MDAAPLLGEGNGGDYAPARTFKEFKKIVWSETVKTWLISGPVIFQIVCQYGTNSVTNIFVGQLGELELSGISIAISVIATFAFGFMVCTLSISLLLLLSPLVRDLLGKHRAKSRELIHKVDNIIPYHYRESLFLIWY